MWTPGLFVAGAFLHILLRVFQLACRGTNSHARTRCRAQQRIDAVYKSAAHQVFNPSTSKFSWRRVDPAIASLCALLVGAHEGPLKVLVVGDAYSGGPAKRGDRHGAAGLKTLLRCCVRACVEPAAGLCCAFMRLCCLFCVQAIEGHTITGPEPYSSQYCCLCEQPLLRRLKSRCQFCPTHGIVARDIVRGLLVFACCHGGHVTLAPMFLCRILL